MSECPAARGDRPRSDKHLATTTLRNKMEAAKAAGLDDVLAG